jgi:hypothetical protein
LPKVPAEVVSKARQEGEDVSRREPLVTALGFDVGRVLDKALDLLEKRANVLNFGEGHVRAPSLCGSKGADSILGQGSKDLDLPLKVIGIGLGG